MREALRILAEEELIDMQVNRRPRIAQPSLERVLDLMDVLLSLESLAVRLCIERASADEVAGIANIQAPGPAPCRAQSASRLFQRRHGRPSCHRCGQPQCATDRDPSPDRGRRSSGPRFLASRHLEWRSVTLQEHDDLVHAIVQRRADAAVEALIQHLGTVRNAITALFQAATKVDDLPFAAVQRGPEPLLRGTSGGSIANCRSRCIWCRTLVGKDGS